MRLRNNKNAKLELESCENVIKNFPFKVEKNSTLEIGMGKGQMLIELAQKNPQKIFVGIEKYPTVALIAAKKAKKLELNNFFIIVDDVENALDFFEGTFDLIWLTFSDPWPKKRHYKRRLTYEKFLKIYSKILSENGLIKLKTDNDDFFKWSLESLEKNGLNIINKTNDLEKSEFAKDNVKTSYEQKFVSLGKNINFVEFSFKK